MKKMPIALPARLVVPEYSTVIAAKREVVMRQPKSPVRYIPRCECILSCNQAPWGL
jgi:hypothetical protein